MRLSFKQKHYSLLLGLFLISRLLLPLLEVKFQSQILLTYWQYLDLETLQHDLLKGLYYDHTQPPFFNAWLGLVLKVFGDQSSLVFAISLKALTLINTSLLYGTLTRVSSLKWVPLAGALVYLMSPATMVMEQELFYTPFITLFLLLALRSLILLPHGISTPVVIGLFGSLVLVCLTRSMYHVFWLLLVGLLVVFLFRGQKGWGKLIGGGMIALLLTGGWYLKNKLVFGQFTSSTWMGMNLARNVFHDAMADSGSIARLEPFSPISAYTSFIPEGYTQSFQGKLDRVLLEEYKNGPYLNAKQVGYIPVANAYLEACKEAIRKDPVHYGKNVAQSAFIYFAPMTRYPSTEFLAKKLKYYDLVYSFNLSQLAEGKQQRRMALLLSALPKMAIYLLVFSLLIGQCLRTRKAATWQWFILLLFAYSFTVSSLFEHFENMRFRFEAEPLFYVLAASILPPWWQKIRKRKQG